MSNIIKGERIRTQTVINLQDRFYRHNEYEEEEDKSTQELSPSILNDKIEIIIRQAEEDAKYRAAQIIQQAQLKANELMQEADNHVEEDKHYSNKLITEAKQEAKMQLEEANQEKKRILKLAEEEKQTIIAEVEPELVGILIKLLNHIIGDTLFENVDWLRCLVRKMILKENIDEPLTVVVSPATYELLTMEIMKTFKWNEATCQFKIDENMKESSCRVETDSGNITYDVKEGLSKVITELKLLQTLE